MVRVTLKNINKIANRYGLELVKWNDSHGGYYYYSCINSNGDKLMLNADDGTIHCFLLNDYNMVRHENIIKSFVVHCGGQA